MSRALISPFVRRTRPASRPCGQLPAYSCSLPCPGHLPGFAFVSNRVKIRAYAKIRSRLSSKPRLNQRGTLASPARCPRFISYAVDACGRPAVCVVPPGGALLRLRAVGCRSVSPVSVFSKDHGGLYAKAGARSCRLWRTTGLIQRAQGGESSGASLCLGLFGRRRQYQIKLGDKLCGFPGGSGSAPDRAPRGRAEGRTPAAANGAKNGVAH